MDCILQSFGFYAPNFEKIANYFGHPAVGHAHLVSRISPSLIAILNKMAINNRVAIIID